MLVKIIKNFVFILLLVVAELSLFRALGSPFNLLSPIMVALVFTALLDNFKKALIYAIIFGFILDLFSAGFIGVYMLAFVLSLIVVDRIYNKLFTNKSLYSLIFMVITVQTIVNYVFNIFEFIKYFIADKTIDFSRIFNVSDLYVLGYAILINIILTIIVFLAFYLFSNKFKAVLIR